MLLELVYSKEKVWCMRPFGKIVATPYEVSRTEDDLEE